MEKETKIGFLEVSPGHKSNGRLLSLLTIIAALFLATLIIATGCYIAIDKLEVSPLIAAAGAAGTEFVTIAGSAMWYAYNHKKQEK